MLRRKYVPVILAFAAFVAIPVLADEVVHFTNGTSLPIRSHRIEKDMVAVDLGSDSRMSFPTYMVDKIEAAGRQVYLNPTYHPTNQAVGGATRPDAAVEVAEPTRIDTTVTADGSTTSRRGGRGGPMGPGDYTAVGAPADASASGARVNSAMSRIRPVGNRALLNTGSTSADAMVGAGPQGSTVIAQDPADPAVRRAGAVRVGPRQNEPTPATPPASTDANAPPAETPPPDTTQDPPPSDPPSSD